MTLHEQPPIVDLDELLHDQEAHRTRVTAGQWLLVVGGGIVGAAGLLALLAVTAPMLVNLVQLIHTLTQPGTASP
jgi:hypothetical protein